MEDGGGLLCPNIIIHSLAFLITQKCMNVSGMYAYAHAMEEKGLLKNRHKYCKGCQVFVQIAYGMLRTTAPKVE